MTTVKNIYDYINSVAPYESQEEWDNSGHLVGDFRKEVKKVVMSLDCTKAVVNFANDVNADLVLTHHPLIFGGLKNVMSDTAVYNLINSNIAYLCAHTNFDKAECGINTNLAKLLGLNDTYTMCDNFVVVGSLDSPMILRNILSNSSARQVSDIPIPTNLSKPLQSVEVRAVNLCLTHFKRQIAL